MILAISQYNGFNKYFETFNSEDDDRKVRKTIRGNRCVVDHTYDSDTTAHNFFILESKYHLSFRLEFILWKYLLLIQIDHV